MLGGVASLLSDFFTGPGAALPVGAIDHPLL